MSRQDSEGTDQSTATCRVGMIGLGCAKNLVDGEVMLGLLRRAGVEITPDLDQADVVIVNTCGFIVDAKRESIEAILEVAEARAEGRIRRFLVAGCMAQAYAEELAREIPEIDDFVGLDELDRVVQAVMGSGARHLPDQTGAVRLYDHTQPRVLATAGYAYLKVAEGCDNPCTFCHIPRMRGRFRSRPMEDLVAEARRLEAVGVRELVLIAQDTTRYGEDLGISNGLRRLVESLLDATRIPWLRVLYAYPATLDEGLFALMAREPRFLPYLDIPLQHANRRVLKAMRRGGDSRAYRALIERARATVPDLTLRTTMIVGFPGEDEAAFSELERFVREIGFDHLGVFCYSWQEENPGAELGDPVTSQEKEIRRDRLMTLQHDISLARNQELVGRRMVALLGGAAQETELLQEGRLARQAPEIDGRLLVNEGRAPFGSLVEVEITEAHPYDLVGSIVRVLQPGSDSVQRLPVLG